MTILHLSNGIKILLDFWQWYQIKESDFYNWNNGTLNNIDHTGQYKNDSVVQRKNQFESTSDWSNRDVWSDDSYWEQLSHGQFVSGSECACHFNVWIISGIIKKAISTMWQTPVGSRLEIRGKFVTGECCRLCYVWIPFWKKQRIVNSCDKSVGRFFQFV